MRYGFGAILAMLTLFVACSSDDTTSPDTTPPASIQDASFQDSTGHTVVFTWTAPGDDGENGQASQYDIRYSASYLEDALWDSATVINQMHLPKPAGETESLSVSGLSDGTWHFGLKAADEVPNWSELSNILSINLVDSFPPDPIIDLSVSFATVKSVKVSWTTPDFDAEKEGMYAYDLRYSHSPITEETWVDATQVEDLPSPGIIGSEESCIINDLGAGVSYYIAVKTMDDAGNTSALSNPVIASTAHLEQLTHTDGAVNWSGASYPMWSPDGQTVCFRATWEKDRPPFTNLHLIPAAGGDSERLTYTGDTIYAASWSPDGQNIVFVTLQHIWHEIFITNATPGSSPIQLTNYGGSMAIYDIAWSPDGTNFAFIHSPWPDPTDYVYTMSSSGGDAYQLTSGINLSELEWSHDSSKLIFHDYDVDTYDIWSIPLAGGRATQLTNDPADDMYPTLSPDGTKIAFVSNRSGDYDIWVMSSTGSDLYQLTFDSIEERALDWSPDGKRIAYSAFIDKITDIWVVVLE